MTGVRRHTVCWLIRHGQTAWNRESRYLSHTDLPLTGFGLQRAEAAGWRLRRQPLTAVVYSGLRRTEETALALASGRRTPPELEVDQDWRESDHGCWEGLTYAEVMEAYPREARARFADPWSNAPCGGESLAETNSRVLNAWRRLLGRHDGGRVAVVTHATPIQMALHHALGMSGVDYWRLRIDLGSISCVDLYPAAAIVRSINELPPLRRPDLP